MDHEPAVTLEDTHPRPAVAPPPSIELDAPRSNRLIVGTVLVALVFMCVASISLAGVAGWRDGYTAFQTLKASTQVAYIEKQQALANDDLKNERYEIAFERCKYILTLQPYYPGAAACLTTAQLALSVTPTATTSPTPIPLTPTPAPTNTPGSGLPSAEELFIRGQTAIRDGNYETAMNWLEALRGLNANYRRKDVEDMLVKTYLALGDQYKFQGRLSEMVVVIKKALQIRDLGDTDWPFTINVTELYLSGRDYLNAENYTLASQVFERLMGMAPTYLDTRDLACQAFTKAGNTAAFTKYCQG